MYNLLKLFYIFFKPIAYVFNLYVGLRQERPSHVRQDGIHPAMRERGRAIPTTASVPIVQKPPPEPSKPRLVEGRVSFLKKLRKHSRFIVQQNTIIVFPTTII